MENSASLAMFQLSQVHLQTLEICPRKFQYQFVDQLSLPQLAAATERQQQGQQFHQLMQQQALDLDIQPLLAQDAALQAWFQTFDQHPPPLIQGDRLSEVSHTLAVGGGVLTAVFDLLIQGPAQAQIVDWKTYARPLNPTQLQQRWQSRLYPFILAATGCYRPEDITLTYWFVTGEPHALTFPYSTAQYQQTQQHIQAIIQSLEQWLTDWRDRQQPFPQAPVSAGHCVAENHLCPFVSYCDRHPAQQPPPVAHWLNLDAIAEVPPN